MKNRRISLYFFLTVLLSLLGYFFAYAETPQDEYRKVQREIKKHNEKLGRAKKYESSILSDLERNNKQLTLVETDLRKYGRSIINTAASISKIESEIALCKMNIERHREWIKRRLRTIYINGRNKDTLLLLFHADDISQIMRGAKYLQYISVYEHNMLNQYRENLDILSIKERQLLKLRTDLIRHKEQVEIKKASFKEKKKKKETLLTSIRKEKSSYTEMLRELKRASRELLEVIRESEKSNIIQSKGFLKLKGKLPWPVDGKIAIPYGSQKDPQFNTPLFRSGAYIESSADSFAKAVHEGKVVFAEWFKGYGQLVIVTHGDGYHTLYGSLSEIFTKVGDIIKRKQVIGRSGDSGILDSSGLYFEVRYKGKPLDPLQWLEKR